MAGLLSDDSQDKELEVSKAEESFSKLNLSSSLNFGTGASIKDLIKKAQVGQKAGKVIKPSKIKLKRGKSEPGTSSSSANTSFADKQKQEALKTDALIFELGKQKMRELEEEEKASRPFVPFSNDPR